jgi:hypothetical protein
MRTWNLYKICWHSSLGCTVFYNNMFWEERIHLLSLHKSFIWSMWT